MKRLAETYKEH